MIVDCDRCAVRGEACGECVITVLLGSPPGGVELDATERRALENLAAAGLVPRLQLVRSDEPQDVPGKGSGGEAEENVQRPKSSAKRSKKRAS